MPKSIAQQIADAYKKNLEEQINVNNYNDNELEKLKNDKRTGIIPVIQVRSSMEQNLDEGGMINKALSSLNRIMLQKDVSQALNYLKSNGLLNTFNQISPIFLKGLEGVNNLSTPLFENLLTTFITTKTIPNEKPKMQELIPTPIPIAKEALHSTSPEHKTLSELKYDLERFESDPPQLYLTKARNLNKRGQIRLQELKDRVSNREELEGIISNKEEKRPYNLPLARPIEGSIEEPTSTGLKSHKLNINFGIKHLSHSHLLKNHLLLTNINKSKYFINKPISKKLSKIFIDLLKENQYKTKDFNNLDNDEKELLEHTINYSKKKMGNKNYENNKEKIKRFEILRGELISGNNNINIIKELKQLLLLLMRNKLISKSESNDVLYSLSFLI